MAPPRPSFSAAEMLHEMDAIGVDGAVIVPPVWAGDANDTALAAAEQHPQRFAVMGRFDPFAPDIESRFEHEVARPHLLGFRMSGRWGARPLSFTDALRQDALEPFWDLCETRNVPLMCLTLREPELLAPVAKRHPNLTLIVDHMAAAEPPDTPASAALLHALVALAEFPCVHVKVSGVPNRSRLPYPFEDMHPVVRALYDSFGPARLLWAADITQLTKNTYAECLRVWQEGIPFLTAADRSAILGENAARVLRWPLDLEAHGHDR